jgi:hypothetical protein
MERVLIDALSLAPATAQAALDTLRQHLQQHPADIERVSMSDLAGSPPFESGDRGANSAASTRASTDRLR